MKILLYTQIVSMTWIFLPGERSQSHTAQNKQATQDLTFSQGLELDFIFGALTCSSTAHSLVLRARDYNFSWPQLVKISEVSMTKTTQD